MLYIIASRICKVCIIDISKAQWYYGRYHMRLSYIDNNISMKQSMLALIGGFKVSDAIGSGGANTLERARGQRHFSYYFLLGVGKLRLHNLLNFCKSIKESFNFTSCDQFLGIF